MRDISKQLRVSLFWAVITTMLFGLMISLFFHRQAIDREEMQSTLLLHSTVEEIVRPSLRISDYAEVRRILERISAKSTVFAVIIPPQDIIVGDYQLTKKFQIALQELGMANCLSSQTPMIKHLSPEETIACNHLSSGKLSETPVAQLLTEQAILVTLFKSSAPSKNIAFLVMLLATVSVVALMVAFLMSKLLIKNLISPIKSLSAALEGNSLAHVRVNLNKLDTNDLPKEIHAVLVSYQHLLDQLEHEMSKREHLTGEAAKAELARQIAHDIRSPLAALEMASRTADGLPEDSRLMIRHASSRIKDIANTLLRSGKEESPLTTDKTSVEMISSLLESILAEKRTQFRSKQGFEINSGWDESCYGIFVSVNKRELERIISNLINNSAEAILGAGVIEVSMRSENECVKITIRDNGKGIPPEILPTLGKKGVSFGPKTGGSGSGLGLHHAISQIEKWKGNLKIYSELNKGTTVDIILPKTPHPNWFVPEIVITSSTQIVSLDDDTSIHGIWKKRFPDKVITFVNGESLKEWLMVNPCSDSFLFLVDYELIGQKQTGLDIIENLKLSPFCHLVTSRYDDLQIRNRCLTLGIGLIPKSMASFIPIKIKAPREKTQRIVVLIDNDELVHLTWNQKAKEAGITLCGFLCPGDFESKVHDYDKDTEIFLDSNFPNGTKGERFLPHLRSYGFSHITLTTGYESENFLSTAPGVPVIGKTPPF